MRHRTIVAFQDFVSAMQGTASKCGDADQVAKAEECTLKNQHYQDRFGASVSLKKCLKGCLMQLMQELYPDPKTRLQNIHIPGSVDGSSGTSSEELFPETLESTRASPGKNPSPGDEDWHEPLTELCAGCYPQVLLQNAVLAVLKVFVQGDREGRALLGPGDAQHPLTSLQGQGGAGSRRAMTWP